MRPPKLYDSGLRRPADEAVALAQQYCVDEALDGRVWKTFANRTDPGRELIELTARLIELVAERLNRVPEKNLLAFLDLVGVERAPGTAAEAPVTFLLSAGSDVGQPVPARTRVATTQSESADAEVFETREPFFATRAKLVLAVSLFPQANRFASLLPLALPPKPEDLASPGAIPIIDDRGQGQRPVDHTLYLASAALFARAEPADVTLEFTVVGDVGIFKQGLLTWRRFDGDAKDWVEIDQVDYRSTGQDTVVVSFSSFPRSDKAEVAGDKDAWIAGSLDGMPKTTAGGLPRVTRILGRAETATPPIVQADAASFNETKLDLSRPMRPFGERPRYGDAFHIASAMAFAPDVASAIIRVTLNPYARTDLERTFATILEPTNVTTTVEWQYLGAGGVWKTISTFTHVLKVTRGAAGQAVSVTQLDDHQQAATADEKNWTLFGTIGGTATLELAFAPQNDAVPSKIGGIDGYWIRAILRSQNPYGQDGFVRITTQDGTAVKAVDPTFIPPVIEKIEIQYDLATSPVELDRVTTLNNFEFRKIVQPGSGGSKDFSPFVLLEADQAGVPIGASPACYLGFDRAFGNVFVSLLIALQEARSSVQLLPETSTPRVAWEYLAPDSQWKPLDVTDGTGDLISSGIVGFLAPATDPHVLFPELTGGASLHWYRVRQDSGAYGAPPMLEMMLINSVMADNQETVSGDWILASGSGERGQSATILKWPVLSGDIWVRENEVPNTEELNELVGELADSIPGDASEADVLGVRPAADASEDRQVWVRWLRVPNFRASGSRSRHYTLEAATGEVTFGGVAGGLIPPIGKDNIVVRRLCSGGGEAANRIAAPLAIKELKSSLPFIDKVFNVRAALGGSDPWTLEQTYALGPQVLKNRNRAVSSEDYVWVTISNFSEVERARSLPTKVPRDDGSLAFKPGAVSVIVVPKGREPMPQPTKGLLRRIEAFLRSNALGAIDGDIHALAPVYRTVSIFATVRAKRPEEASAVARRVVQRLDDFFHPLTGGEQHQGWTFGRKVYLSEVYAEIERTEGVDHVITADFAGAEPVIEENMLVASGTHQITIG